MDIFAEIGSALTKADRILVVTHVSPDGDALGSLTAMGQALLQLDKEPTIVCDDGISSQFSYLPLANQVQTKPDFRNPYDLMIAVDCGDERRMGNAYHNLPEPKPRIINIDHHVTNTLFGQINLVDAAANSTTEILAYLLPKLGVELTAEIAESLLTGLVTDTLCFRTTSVTAHTLQVASKLMEAGADLATITSKALNVKPLSTLLMWRIGLNKMQLEDGVAWAAISYAEQQALGYGNASSHGLGNMLADVDEVAVSVVFNEREDKRVTVGFRTRPPYNVAEIAAEFGGGGHRYASGCTIEGSLDEIVNLVVERTKSAVRTQRCEAKTA